MSLFRGVEDAQVGGGGIYFLPGLYEVEIEKVFTMRSRKDDDLFIVETKILKSDNPERKVGTSCSWVVNLKQDAALGNIKAFIGAANGIEGTEKERLNEEITEAVCEFVCGEDNPLAGVRLGLQCTNILTKAKKDFTKHWWSPV
jgi:hypothetical protein